MEDLYTYAERNHIGIHEIHTQSLKSLSMPNNIGVDKSKMENRQELNTCLAHELGHCMTGSFYNIHSKFDLREKHEYRANKWAIQKFVPFDKLLAAFRMGITELWELAEHFGVTEDFIKKAYVLYEEKLLEFRQNVN